MLCSDCQDCDDHSNVTNLIQNTYIWSNGITSFGFSKLRWKQWHELIKTISQKFPWKYFFGNSGKPQGIANGVLSTLGKFSGLHYRSY